MKTIKYKTNINCGTCINSVTPFLNELDNIDTWKVDIQNSDKILQVNLEDENEKIVVEFVENAGFEIEKLV